MAAKTSLSQVTLPIDPAGALDSATKQSAQAADSDLTAIAALAPADGSLIQRVSGVWNTVTMSALKTAMTFVKGDVGLGSVDNTADTAKPVSTAQQTALDGKQPLDSDLTTIAGLTATTDSIIQSKSSAWVARTVAQFKTDLALAKADVGLDSVDNTADTAKPVSTAQQTALDGKQPLDSDLTAIAGLTATTDSIIQSKASAWVARTVAQFKTDLALTKSDVGLGSVDNTADTAKPVSTAQQTAIDGKQTLDSDLTTIAGLTATTDSFLQSKSSAWSARTIAQVRTDLNQVKPWPPVTLTDAATIATNAALGTHFRCTLTASRSLGAPTNPTDGQVGVWELTASGGAWVVTLVTTAGGFAFGSDITALTAMVSAKTDYLQAIYNTAADRWRVIGYVKGF